MKTGIEMIKAERERQVSREGFDASHDDAHDRREMARAAECYLHHYVARSWTFKNDLGMPGVADDGSTYSGEEMPDDWPWEESYWKPKTPIDDLVKVGALVAAEIDRLLRAGAEAPAPPDSNTEISGGGARPATPKGIENGN